MLIRAFVSSRRPVSSLAEDFSYFTLLRPATPGGGPATSLFGISCTRQIDAAQLLVRPPDVTRSTVQKAVVIIADSPQYFGMLRERLSVVTKAWFAQREFDDVDILRRFQESLAEDKARGLMHEDHDRDQYLGLSLRELVREFRWQTLVLLKCCLLQPKVFFLYLPSPPRPVCDRVLIVCLLALRRGFTPRCSSLAAAASASAWPSSR